MKFQKLRIETETLHKASLDGSVAGDNDNSSGCWQKKKKKKEQK